MAGPPPRPPRDDLLPDTVASERPLPTPPAAVAQQQFLFSSLSNVWKGLKAELRGFTMSISTDAPEETTQVGSKRARSDSVSGPPSAGPSTSTRASPQKSQADKERGGKRRKMDTSRIDFWAADDEGARP